jgi:glycosyltransferase involved in cell wall biosynthesis
MESRIKIAIVISSMRTGGKENMVKAVFQRLDRDRFDPFLCVMNTGELLQDLDSQRLYSQLSRYRGDVLGYIWRMLRIFQKERPQVIYCLSYRIPGWVSRSLAKILGIPVIIYELHGVEDVRQRDLELPDRWLFNRFTDHMIAIGPGFRQNLIRDGVAENKITVIRNGVDTQRFYPQGNQAALKQNLLGLSAETPVIGCITKMRPVKNLPMLVAAFKLVQEHIPATRLVIAGDGSERLVVEDQIKKLGLTSQVHLLGLRRDVPDLLNAFDVFALSSSSETAPLAILEAGACGVPVVSTAVGEIPEIVLEGQTGFLVPPGDGDALAKRLLDILADRDLRDRMSQAARQHILNNFSLDASIRAREDLFLRLLHGKGAI